MKSSVVTYYFGFHAKELEEVAQTLAMLLNIEWEYHESVTRGGEYCVYRDEKRGFWLHSNNTDWLAWEAPNYWNYELILVLQYYQEEIIPASEELLVRFREFFYDTAFIPHDDLGKLTIPKAFEISPVTGLQLLIVVIIAKVLNLVRGILGKW